MLPDPLTTPCTPIPLVAISAWGRGDQEQQQRLKSPVEVQPTIVKPKNELVVKLPRADLPTPAISSFVLSCFVAFNDGINILNPSGHYMYRTVVTICTAQWSLYVPHSGHCMYRTVVTICTVQWSLYVLHSGHYMYRTAVTICTVQWSLYVPYSGHYMYRTVVTICTASLTFSNSTFCPHSCIYVFCVDLRTNSDYFLYNIN